MYKTFTTILAIAVVAITVWSINLTKSLESEKVNVAVLEEEVGSLEEELSVKSKKVKELEVELENESKRVADKVKAIHSHEKKRDEYLEVIEQLKSDNSNKQAIITDLKAKKMATATRSKKEVKPRASEGAKATVQSKDETSGFHPEPVQVENENNSSTVVGNFQATYYGSDCSGCSGITAGGVNVSGGNTHYNGMRVIAADPSVLPIGTVVNVKGSALGNFTGIVMDTGGAIKGNIIDILVGSEAESSTYGRSNVQVEVLH